MKEIWAWGGVLIYFGVFIDAFLVFNGAMLLRRVWGGVIRIEKIRKNAGKLRIWENMGSLNLGRGDKGKVDGKEWRVEMGGLKRRVRGERWGEGKGRHEGDIEICGKVC